MSTLRSENNDLRDEVRLLKAEIVRVKKSGALSLNNIANGTRGTKQNNFFEGGANQSASSPLDLENLKEELSRCKKELNSLKEENRVLKASAEQYRKRAYFAKNKFNDIKEKVAVEGSE